MDVAEVHMLLGIPTVPYSAFHMLPKMHTILISELAPSTVLLIRRAVNEGCLCIHSTLKGLMAYLDMQLH